MYVLTAANFQDFVMKGDTFVKFYAPWCGHCKKLKPVWSLLGKELNQKEPINIAKVNLLNFFFVLKFLLFTLYNATRGHR